MSSSYLRSVIGVFAQTTTVSSLLEGLASMMRLNLPRTIKIATPWYKPGNNKTSLAPDYYIHETDEWIVFPHELEGLTLDEIAQGKTDLEPILEIFQKS